ncbi:CipC-like antibiotic response protein [Penicillium sp. DV-2018c]|nr:CipC-like antibiotic response protein [Penicillium sp. DV-2018c]KAJ5575694.1 CipC-like antibiotic response protein [Penicillium sp. DV-2018c]
MAYKVRSINHAVAKELIAGCVGDEIDKLAETKGMYGLNGPCQGTPRACIKSDTSVATKLSAMADT